MAKMTRPAALSLARNVGYPIISAGRGEKLDPDANLASILPYMIQCMIELKDAALFDAENSFHRVLEWAAGDPEAAEREKGYAVTEWANDKLVAVLNEKERWERQKLRFQAALAAFEDAIVSPADLAPSAAELEASCRIQPPAVPAPVPEMAPEPPPANIPKAPAKSKKKGKSKKKAC